MNRFLFIVESQFSVMFNNKASTEIVEHVIH